MNDIKIKLSMLWVAHFLIWSFGDMLRLLQPGYIADTNSSNDVLLIASIIGLIQSVMIVLTLLSDDKIGIWANLVIGIVFLLIDLGWLAEIITTSLPIWEFVLLIGYLAFDLLIIINAYLWFKGE